MISICTTFNYDIPLKDQLPMIRSAGFTHISIGSDTMKHSDYLKTDAQNNLREILKNSGLKICSIHAPFTKDADISSPQKGISSGALELFKRCIDAALFLNAKVLIFHATPLLKVDVQDYRKEILLKQVLTLLEYIGEEDLQLAVENLYSIPANDVLSYSLDSIDHPRYGFCYDSSHDNLAPQPLAILEKYAHRLLTTHISDNRGEKDDHILPFEGTFQWDKFCKLFSEIDFRGIFLLEVEMRKSTFKSPEQFLNEAFLRGKELLKQSGKL